MLENILDDEDDAFVFFYEDNDTDAHTILEELEQIDEKLDKQDLAMVKISDEGAIDNYGIETLPALVYFENGVPEIYEGDLLNDGAVLKWMKSDSYCRLAGMSASSLALLTSTSSLLSSLSNFFIWFAVFRLASS